MTDKSITLQKDKSGNEYFLVTFPYDERLVSFVRKIPTRKYVASGWKIKADHVTALYVDAFARKLEFELDDLSKDFIEQMKKPIEEEVNIPELKMKLRNFQKIGVNYATKYERCFIADEMGLGKSAEAIASVMALDAFPCVIICPASLKLNWKKEVNMWCDKTSVVIDGLIKEIYEEIDGNKIISNYEIPDYDADFVIINYDILERDKKIKPSLNPKGIEIPNHKDLLSILKFKSIIIDESQYCSNHKSLRTKAVKQISRKIKYRFALSGTPMLNRPKELIPQLDILDRLESLGGFWGFAKRYCAAFEGDFGWDFSGSSNLDELYSKLKQTCFIRRKKEDVLSELPPKQRILLPIELSNREEYNKASKNFIQWIKNKLMNESEYMEELKKIPMLTDSQRTIMSNARIAEKLNKTREAEALVRIEKLKQLVAKGKLSRVKDFIETFLQYDDKLVIFAKHKEIYKSLIDSYKDISVHVVGGMTSKQKDKAVVEFQTNPKIKLFIGALDAAGVGLTLTESSTVAFIEFGWTSAIHDQAEDRCHRIGQKDFVKCYYFYSEKTIDEDILEIVENKRKIASNIMDGLTIVDDADTNDVEKILSKFI